MKKDTKQTIGVVGVILGLALIGFEPGEREPVAQAYECEELMEGETPSGEIPVCDDPCAELISEGTDTDFEAYCTCLDEIGHYELNACRRANHI